MFDRPGRPVDRAARRRHGRRSAPASTALHGRLRPDRRRRSPTSAPGTDRVENAVRDRRRRRAQPSTSALSEVENTDLAKAIVDLQLQEVAYQAALAATARVMQPSLLDFLR